MSISKKEKEKKMENVIKNLENCSNMREIESLWTKVYLENRSDSHCVWKVLWPKFEAKRNTVQASPCVMSESHKSYGWE